MTVGEFLARLRASPHSVQISREPDGSVFLECEKGWRDMAWSRIPPPASDADVVDDEILRAICRELRIPPSDVGL